MDRNSPITVYESDLWTPLNSNSSFSETSVTVIHGSEKRVISSLVKEGSFQIRSYQEGD